MFGPWPILVPGIIAWRAHDIGQERGDAYS
jgi:hypothetical protein